MVAKLTEYAERQLKLYPLLPCVWLTFRDQNGTLPRTALHEIVATVNLPQYEGWGRYDQAKKMLASKSVIFLTWLDDKYPGVVFISVYDQHTQEYVLCFGVRTGDQTKAREMEEEVREQPGVKLIMKRRRGNASTKP